MIDTQHAVETPEGVRLALRVAGPVARALAFSVDWSLRSIAYVAATLGIVASLGPERWSAMVFVIFLGEWMYPVLFEVLADGRTPGKRVVGIRVVHEDGTRIRWAASLLRNLLLWVDALPGTYLFGLATMVASDDFRRIGDHAAGTLVIYADAVPRTSSAVAASDAPPLAPPIALTTDEQSALLAFGERAGGLSAARCDELAGLATPLAATGEPPAARLLRIAAWLRGGEPAA